MAHTRYPVSVGGTTNAHAMIHLPRWQSIDATGLRAVIALHGHGGGSLQIQQGMAWVGHPTYWADNGYCVASVDTGDVWDNSAAMSAITDLYNYLVNTMNISGPKVAVAGWSMGGGHALRWLIENPTKVSCAWVVSPITDLDWAHAQGAWTAEIDTAYSSNYAANGSSRSPANNIAAFQAGIPIRIQHATDDATVPYTQSTGFVSSVNRSYVTLRQPDITGGHQGGLTQIPSKESLAFIHDTWS